MSDLDFKGLSEVLLQRVGELLPAWLPGGKLKGREYVCGNRFGGQGESFSVNTESGKWADFATGDKGGDLISLFALLKNYKQGEAARILSEEYRFTLAPEKPRRREDEQLIGRPPDGVPMDATHWKYGKHSGLWCYRDESGSPLFYVARYDLPDGKQLVPWSWSETGGYWVNKGWKAPRPLYGLELLRQRPNHPVMVVEGEKCADAGRRIAGLAYNVVTWPNGSSAVETAQWNPLFGKRVLIWPDADLAGKRASNRISELLAPHCTELKVLNVDDMPEKWDVADAVNEGWDWATLVAWAKPRARLIVSASAETQSVVDIPPDPVVPPLQVVAAARADVNVTITTEAVDEGTNSSHYAMWDELGLSRTQNGVVANLDNALRILERHKRFAGKIWHDEFHGKYYSSIENDKPREWDDVDTLNVLAYIQRTLGVRSMVETAVSQAVVIIAKRHVRNEPKDWMESLTWDGSPRIDEFLTECYGAADTAYVRAASRNFWISMAARIFRPGCKVDNMLILEGAQGLGKGKGLSIIGRNWYTEVRESVNSKDFFQVLKGKLICEIAEMDAFSKAEVTKIKQVISCANDRYRAPYSRTPQDNPRQSVFVGTTNEVNYLRDNTGARRFWPIKCQEIRFSLIEKSREQLFAEAVSRFKAGETWYEMPEETTQIEQEKRRRTDEWEEIIEEFCQAKDKVTIKEICVDCLKIDIAKMDLGIQQRIGPILRRMGYEKITERYQGVLRRAWRRSDVLISE